MYTVHVGDSFAVLEFNTFGAALGYACDAHRLHSGVMQVKNGDKLVAQLKSQVFCNPSKR